jgi:hypothetical protein
MTDETYIFFRLHSPDAYAQAQASLDHARGFPDTHTRQAMPDWGDLSIGADEKRYLFIDRWRAHPEDEDLIADMVAAGYADIVSMTEYEQAFAEHEADVLL